MEDFWKIFNCKCDWNIEKDLEDTNNENTKRKKKYKQKKEKYLFENIDTKKSNYLNPFNYESSFFKINEEKNTGLLGLSFSEIYSNRSNYNNFDISKDLFELKNSFK